MVRVILGLEQEPSSSHEADAFAVAICHALGSPLARIAR
jgi:Holliday junction resolvasome RuvABC endonuclease subunit